MRLLYLSESFTGINVFTSQVHTLCNYHAENFNVTLFALCGPKEIKVEGPQGRKYDLVKGIRLPKAFFPIINWMNSYLFPYRTLLAKIDVIHCRGHVGTAYAINLRKRFKLNVPIIADIRGELIEELKAKQPVLGRIYALFARKLEKYIFENADRFFFVSDNMQKYYLEKYESIEGRSHVFPTIVDERYFRKSKSTREEYRERLGISDKFVFAYVGGVTRWQCVDQIVEKYCSESRRNSNIVLLMIVTNKEYVDEILATRVCSNIQVYSLPYQDVGKYLNAADAGIIIRDRNRLNFVSSPTKVNEYLACGLKIVDNLQDIGRTDLKPQKSYKYRPLKSIIAAHEQIYQDLVRIRRV